MEQYYILQLLRKPEKCNVSFEEIAERAYKTIMLFQKLPKEFRPTYLCANRKKDCKLMEWNYQNFYDILKKNDNHTEEKVFEDLGYTFDCFSSLNNSISCGYSMLVGITNTKLVNSFIMRLSYNIEYFDEATSKQIKELFEESVKIFEPYFGCVYNSLLRSSKKYNTNDDETMPTAVHWLNYWSKDMIGNIGEQKIKRLSKIYKELEYKEGFLKLQDIAIDSKNPKDVEYKAEVEKFLLQ